MRLTFTAPSGQTRSASTPANDDLAMVAALLVCDESVTKWGLLPAEYGTLRARVLSQRPNAMAILRTAALATMRYAVDSMLKCVRCN